MGSPPSTSQRSPWGRSPQQLPNGHPRLPASADLGTPGALIKALRLG